MTSTLLIRWICLFMLGFAPLILHADPFPDPDFPADQVIAGTPGMAVYKTKAKGWDDGKFGVYIPASYKPDQPMPLVVSAHGHGGNGEGEVKSWQKLAEKYNFIVVCPSYFTSAFLTDQNTADDDVMLKEVMTRVFASLNINRKRVLHTGFSGGGFVTWYVAAKHDDWFTALCTRSGNFAGDPDISLSKWRDRPIYIMWGDHDMADIPGQGQAMLTFVQDTMHNTKVKHDVITNGHHESHADLVAAWFAGLSDADFGAPDPDAPVHL